MSIADEVRRLEDENAELKAESEHRKNLLIDQNANYRRILGQRDQQLVDAAAAMDKAEDRIATQDGEIAWLRDKLARFQLVRGMLNEAEYGKSPLNSEQPSFFLPARAN